MADRAAPSSVHTAALLLWGLVALMVVRTLLTVVLLDDLPDSYLPLALVVVLILGGLLALSAVFVTRGANWARVVGCMFASAAALAGLLVLLQPSTVLFTMLGLASAVAGLAAIVLLFSRPANAFFAAQRRRRRSPAAGQPLA